jgi:hypothetical protein
MSHNSMEANVGTVANYTSLLNACAFRGLDLSFNALVWKSSFYIKAACMYALKGLALPRASHSVKIALARSRDLRV